jgi:DtxR family Mn-dependent transcriptional regulator
MLPSSTVENYLKAIYQRQFGLESDELVPMGQLAAMLGVVPGTATTMVKALGEAGLVRYEPYAGVRLTEAGEKLAAMVLRRHRLIELFLVKVMGMNWKDVHEEAEQLEHAVSDRLIERMDEMLGRPAVDPHGDPIPGPEGTVAQPAYQDLLTCPLHTPLVVTRVANQDADFLRFIENHDLKPGQEILVENRDPVADSVQLCGKDARRISLGARAASKVLVDVVRVAILFLLGAGGVAAQSPPPAPSGASGPFAILDNSFLVEEAFNQEVGVFQNILGIVRRDRSDWELAFTQEWPVLSQLHQFSYTVPVGNDGAGTGFGDVLINYRYQALSEGPGRPAFSPRVSVVLHSQDEDASSAGEVGWQVNLPFSKQTGDLYWHWNAGFTVIPQTDEATADSGVTPHFAGSAIWRWRPMFHPMLETLVELPGVRPAAGRVDRHTDVTISPGFRAGWNLADHQVVIGVAVPITFDDVGRDTGVLTYLSYELPFAR